MNFRLLSTGLLKYQDLIAKFPDGQTRMSIRKLEQVPPDSGDYRSALKDVRLRGDTRFLLDCEWYAVQDILHQVMDGEYGKPK